MQIMGARLHEIQEMLSRYSSNPPHFVCLCVKQTFEKSKNKNDSMKT